MTTDFEAKHPRANPGGRGRFSTKTNSEPEAPIGSLDLPPRGPDLERRDGTDSWRAEPVIVFGRKFTLGDVSGGRLYHGSRASLRVGSVLTPGHAQNFLQSPSDSISITSDPAVARHWARQSGDGPDYVYEVESVGPVDAWRVMLTDGGKSFRLLEGRCGSAVVTGETART